MPFFVLQLNEDSDELKSTLLGFPNGTLLDTMCAIRTDSLMGYLRVYWLEPHQVTLESIDRVRALVGVDNFQEILDISISIHDKEWKWNDIYINDKFKQIINKIDI